MYKPITLANIPQLQQGRPRGHRRRPRISISIQTIATMIDPGAWEKTPQPSRQRLETELAQAHELIAALCDEIEWLSAGKADALKNPVLIQRAGRGVPVVDDAVDQQRRQEVALRTAQNVVAACKKMLGGRKLIIVQGGRVKRYGRFA